MTLDNRSWLLIGAAAIIAGGAGFGLARLTAKAPPAAAPPAASGPAALEIAPAELAASGVAVETAGAGNLSAEVLAPASVVAAPGGEAIVSAHAAGAISRLTKRLGDPVRAGETLALVDSQDAASLAAQRAAAEARAALARKVAAREQRLFEQRVSPRQDLETAQAGLAAAEAEARGARAAAAAAHVARDGRSAAVVSPINGRITAAAAALGAYVEPGTELFRIADPRLAQVEAQVTAAEAARIAAGDPAQVTASTGASAAAQVRAVTPTLSQETRTATVVLALTGANPFRPGETLQARIAPRAAAPSGVVIPDEAIQKLEGRDVVFVRTAKGFVSRGVTVGSRGGGRALIVSGLKAGEAIATRNAFLLKAELGKGGEEE